VAALPFVDEISRDVRASPAATFAAVERHVDDLLGRRGTRVVTRALGCEPPEGFAVSESVAPRQLTLDGRHRFSRYRLAFVVEPDGDGGARVRARTYAAFPGLAGRAYRAAVIGSRGHVVAVRRMLRSVARGAEAGRGGA
jgi:hypothetical protein